MQIQNGDRVIAKVPPDYSRTGHGKRYTDRRLQGRLLLPLALVTQRLSVVASKLVLQRLVKGRSAVSVGRLQSAVS